MATLDVSGNCIGKVGLFNLLRMLEENKSITHLVSVVRDSELIGGNYIFKWGTLQPLKTNVSTFQSSEGAVLGTDKNEHFLTFSGERETATTANPF